MRIIVKKKILLLILLSAFLAFCESPSAPSILITDVLLVDGSGTDPVVTSVRFSEGIITEIGNLNPRQKNEEVISGSGLVLSPGFVDSHSHHDWDTLRTVEAAVSQGITTIVVGQDGGMNFPLRSYFDSLERNPLSVNLASYAGHNRLRREVLGQDNEREATAVEVEEMKSHLAAAMEDGALGLSTGLEYFPGKFSTSNEVLELAKTASDYGGRYISHMRSEDLYLEEAVNELLTIGHEAQIPVQISHFKIIGKSQLGTAAYFVQKLDSARQVGIQVTADVYPYEYWQSTMKVLFPNLDFDSREASKIALTEFTRPEWVIISRYNANKSYEGKLLSEVAEERNEDPEVTLIELIKLSEETPGESIIAKSMIAEDISAFFNWPHTNVCSDGSPYSHPRGWGAFPKYFSMYKDIPIQTRIQKMTSLSAEHVGLSGVGIIKLGASADLVLFDPEKFKDRSTFENPTQRSEGIVNVWVSGVSVYNENGLTNETPGRILRKNVVR